MLIEIDFSSDIPIYIQLRNEIVRFITSEEIKPEESLPSVRRLANDLNINHMTVAKAYQLLKSEGFIEIDRRIGAKVIAREDVQDILLKEFEKQVDQLIERANLLGMDQDSLVQMILNRKR